MGNHRNQIAVFVAEGWRRGLEGGKKVGRGQVLGGEDAIHGLERELAPAMQKIGEMGLAETGLAGKQRDTQRSALNSAQQFQAEALVHLGEIHL